MAKTENKAEALAHETEAPYDPMQDMVSVHLPRATGNEENYELVSLNGKVWKIMKGVTVQIPRPVYMILAESKRMEDRLRAFNDEQSGKIG